MQITGTLGSATHSVTDTFDSANVGMLAFWVQFGFVRVVEDSRAPDNGIDFSNVNIEFVPEPSTRFSEF